jgi:integrase
MAREDGRIHTNPAQGVSAGRIPAREWHRYLTTTEVAALAAACGDQGDIVTILAFTGCAGPNSSDYASVTSTSWRGGSTSARPRQKWKAGSSSDHRRLGLPSEPSRSRKSSLTRSSHESRTDAAGQQAITSPNGGFLRSNNWRRHTHWNRALKKTKLAPLTIHDLRHTYASLARASGADLRYVQKTLGRSTPTVTANIYSDLYSDELDHVATNLDRLNDSAANQANGQEPDKTNHQ